MEFLVIFLCVCCVIGFGVVCVGTCAFAYAAWESVKEMYRDWKFDRACRLHAKKMKEEAQK